MAADPGQKKKGRNCESALFHTIDSCILSAVPLCSAGMAGGSTNNALITPSFLSELDKCFGSFSAEMFSVLSHPYLQNSTDFLFPICQIQKDLVESWFNCMFADFWERTV